LLNRFIDEFKAKELGTLLEQEPLAKHTTFRVGGPAKVMVIPASKEALVQTMELIADLGISWKVIGKGSNLLPSDKEFDGVVVKCDKGMDSVSVQGSVMTVGSGVSTILLAKQAAKLGLSGLEFISGVPGTVGGAIYMNAGAYKMEMKDILIRALIIDEKGKLRWLSNEEFEFSYRTSIMQQHPDWIVVEAELQLEEADSAEILELMDSRRQRRKESQPLEMPSAGSTFRNPLPHASWKLIEDAGLRGTQVGGAQVSKKHCNFIVNVGGATATDILDLITHVQAVVKDTYDIELHPEVEMFNW